MSRNFQVETGDIYLTRFHPGYGSEFKRFRPAVIASGRVSKIDSRFVLIAPLTTDLKVRDSNTELLIAGNEALEEDSLLLTWYLQTMDSRRLVKKLGRLSDDDCERLRQALRLLVD